MATPDEEYEDEDFEQYHAMTEAQAMSPPKTDNQPGSAPACIEEREERAAMATEIHELKVAIGEAPDPTAAIGERDGTGIKGTLSRIMGGLVRLESKVDELGKSRSLPPPDSKSALSQKIAIWIAVLLMAAQQVPTVYAALRGTAAAATSVGAKP